LQISKLAVRRGCEFLSSFIKINTLIECSQMQKIHFNHLYFFLIDLYHFDVDEVADAAAADQSQ